MYLPQHQKKCLMCMKFMMSMIFNVNVYDVLCTLEKDKNCREGNQSADLQSF